MKTLKQRLKAKAHQLKNFEQNIFWSELIET